MSDNNNARNGGIGFFGALGILFIALKLCGVVDWEWWIVLSPIWGSILFVLILVTVMVVIDRWLG